MRLLLGGTIILRTCALTRCVGKLGWRLFTRHGGYSIQREYREIGILLAYEVIEL